MIIKRIEELRKKLNYSMEELSDKIGMTRSGYSKMIKNGDPKISVLFSLSEVFNVHITYFFEEKSSLEGEKSNLVEDQKQTYGIKKENEILKERIKDLEKIIGLLEKEIEHLKIPVRSDNSSYDIETDAVLKKKLSY